MRNYISEPELFDEVVREMVKLSSLFYFSDLIQYNKFIATFPYTVKYDNFPLYFVTEHGKKQGRIGLIDIEDIETPKDAKGLTNLVRMFPLHHDIIKQEADRLSMSMSGDNDRLKTMNYDINQLKDAAETGMKYLAVGYCDHHNMLRDKKVSPDSSQWSLDISEERLDDLKKMIEAECLLLNKGENGLTKTTSAISPKLKIS